MGSNCEKVSLCWSDLEAPSIDGRRSFEKSHRKRALNTITQLVAFFFFFLIMSFKAPPVETVNDDSTCNEDDQPSEEACAMLCNMQKGKKGNGNNTRLCSKQLQLPMFLSSTYEFHYSVINECLLACLPVFWTAFGVFAFTHFLTV